MSKEARALYGYCPHGRTYSSGCRCDVCKAHVAYDARVARRKKTENKWGANHLSYFVDGAATTRAIQDAMAVRGITGKEIARVTRLSTFTVYHIYHERPKKVKRTTESAVLKHYGPDKQPPRVRIATTLVPYSDYQWKLYAILAQGWTQKDLKKILNADGRTAGWLQHISRPKSITWQTAQDIDRLVELIGDRRGPSSRTAGRMARRGVFPMIHYNESGRLLRASLTDEQLALWRPVR